MPDINFAKFLRAAIVNQRIYPSGSPIIEGSVAQMLKTLNTGFEKSERITMSMQGDKMTIDNKDVTDAGGLLAVIDEHEIKSLTFLPGLTTQEIGKLVKLLSSKKIPDQSVGDWLAQNEVTHILADKVTMMEVLEGEVVMKKIDQIFEGINDFSHLVGSIREAYDMMDKIPDPKSRAQVQEQMSRRLAAMHPSLLRDMFENELPRHVEESGLREGVLNAMTQDKIHDIFSEIATWYRVVRSQSKSDFEVVEQLNKLKSFLSKILVAPASKSIPFALYEELLNQGFLDQIPTDIPKTSIEDSVAYQVDRLLEKPSSALLEQPIRDSLPGLLKKMCDIGGLSDPTEKLLQKLVENFSLGTILVRQVAVRTTQQFLEILWAAGQTRFAGILTKVMEDLLDSERSSEVYKALAEVIKLITVRYAIEGQSGKALELLQILRRHRFEETPLVPHRPEQAEKALKDIAQKLMDILADDMLSENTQKMQTAHAMLKELGDLAAPYYLSIIKRSNDLRQRLFAATVLKQQGPAALKAFSAEFHPGNSTDVLLRLLSVVADIASPEIVPAFENLLNHPEPVLRQKVVQILSKIEGPEAQALLVKFLEDDAEEVTLEAVRAAGELKIAGATARLMSLLKSPSTRLMEEACLALGHTADPQAIPALVEVAEVKGGGLFNKKKSTEETVRVRAVWALGQIKSPKAREVLLQMTKDPNMQIQSIARNALQT